MSVPVTLVTGFLGAGKTTLVNHLLGQAGTLRVAVVENEFGDVGVDGALLNAPSGLVFELTEGCVCCTVRDDLVDVFRGLADRLDELDHVVVETSGLATPGPVMLVFDQADLRGAFHLDGVITVVDATQVLRDLGDVAACADQITNADLLVLNKADLANEDDLAAVEERVRSLNPLARRVRAEGAAVSLEQAFGLGGSEHLEALVRAQGHGHHHHTHQHEEDITSVVADVAGDLDAQALDLWLGRLMRSPDLDLLRMKGVLALPGHPARFVFHAVRGALDLRPHTPWGEEPRRSRIVFIGRGLDAHGLQQGLEAVRLGATPQS